jgi:hypothetical protein
MAEKQRLPEPPYLKGFFVLLPDAMPVPNGSTWTFLTDEVEPLLEGMVFSPAPHLPPTPVDGPARNFASIRFLQVDDPPEARLMADHDVLRRAVDRIVEIAVRDAIDPPEPPKLGRYRTVVELVTFVARSEDLTTTDTKPDPLTRCLDKLLEFHRAYRLIGKLPCEELTYARLHPMVLTTRRLPEDPKPTPDGVLVLNVRPGNVGALVEQIGSVDFHMVTAVYTRLRAGDPTIVAAERMIDARHSFLDLGKNAEAIIQIATSCEVILDGLIGMTLWERGTAPEEAAETFSRDLSARVKQVCSSLVGGRWDLRAGIIGDWYERVAGLRNRVVHAAYQPSDTEVWASLGSADALSNYINDRLFGRAHQYPITAWVFLGRPGFDQRGGAPKRARSWLDEQTEDITVRIKDYSTWRATVGDSVHRRRITA